MLLHEYLDGIQSAIERYSLAELILTTDISSDFRTEKVGIIRGKMAFIDESALHFTEYLDLRYGIDRLTYSYHYQDKDGSLVFRYDNAKHKPALDCQDHKHLSGGGAVPSPPPEFKDILAEITEHLL